jgi:hypothetical protein
MHVFEGDQERPARSETLKAIDEHRQELSPLGRRAQLPRLMAPVAHDAEQRRDCRDGGGRGVAGRAQALPEQVQGRPGLAADKLLQDRPERRLAVERRAFPTHLLVSRVGNGDA